MAFAANLGGGGSGRGFFGAAAAWGIGSRLQLSVGAGTQRSRDANRGAYGARAAMQLWSSSSGSLGGGAFVGVGGAPRSRDGAQVTNPAVMTIPAGVSLAYRREIGTTRGWSLYASPFYSWTRSDSGVVTTAGTVRISAGFDFAFSHSFGATIGGEFGAGGSRGSGSALGAAITFAPGRRPQ